MDLSFLSVSLFRVKHAEQAISLEAAALLEAFSLVGQVKKILRRWRASAMSTKIEALVKGATNMSIARLVLFFLPFPL